MLDPNANIYHTLCRKGIFPSAYRACLRIITDKNAHEKTRLKHRNTSGRSLPETVACPQERIVEPSAEDSPAPAPGAQHLLTHIRDHRGAHPPEPLDPASDSSPQVETPQAQSADRPHVELSAKQRHCSHPATMVKRFDDGLTYCRLCYACLIP